jgi:hypothetical protein
LIDVIGFEAIQILEEEGRSDARCPNLERGFDALDFVRRLAIGVNAGNPSIPCR